MNVWIVNPFDNLPLEGYRPMRFWLMAEAFYRAGHNVVYWTSDFSHANKKRRDLNSNIKIPFDLEILDTEPYFKNVSLKRLLSHRKLAKSFLKKSREAVNLGRHAPADLIIASSPPLELVDAAHTFADEIGAKVIVDIMDAWPETFERVVPRWILWPLRRLARRNYLKAFAITTVADNYIELARSYGFSKDIRRFYHGIIYEEGFDFSFSDSHFSLKGTVPVRVVYAGNMGRSYDLGTVIEAVKELSGLVTLDIAGKGEQEDELKSMVDKKNIKGIVFHGYLTENALGRLLSECDIALVPMDPKSCVGIPYKFADYAKHSLAIVSSLGGESERLLSNYNAGESYVFGNSFTLIRAIRSVMSNLKNIRIASLKMGKENFDAVKIYDGYVAHIMNMLGEHN